MAGTRQERRADLVARGHYYTDACMRCALDCELIEGHSEPPVYTVATCQKWRQAQEREAREKAKKSRRERSNGKSKRK